MKTIRSILMIVVVGLFVMGCLKSPTTDKEKYKEVFYGCLERIPKGPEVVENNDWDEVIAECRAFAYNASTNWN